tara:strand:+ start:87 stop:233 length:147 start_codon:yes stop_codon:yes gene_type:complete
VVDVVVVLDRMVGPVVEEEAVVPLEYMILIQTLTLLSLAVEAVVVVVH